MPIVRRKMKHRREWTDYHRTVLRLGHDWFLEFQDEDLRREAWEDLRDEILDDHIRENPGTRCWAWWKFDSPEPRLLLEGPGAFALKDPERSEELSYGVCRTHTLDDHRYPSVYESEASYLQRLGLLTPYELERLDDLPFWHTQIMGWPDCLYPRRKEEA